MIVKILIGLAVIVAVLCIVIAMRPSDFRFSRSAVIPAPPEVVFGQVNDLHKWEDWSPWAKLDPNCKMTYAGPVAGTGASYNWEGNNQVGEGTMTILESKPNELVRFKLEFRKPFAGTNDVEFTFKPDAGGTAVTWTMTGKNNFMMKAFGLVMDCEKMCGDQFEQGFANLQKVVKEGPKS